jgi:phosphoribosylamine--glycine ligase
VLPLLTSDAAELFLAVADGTLASQAVPSFADEAAVCVVLAAPGYPDSPRTGDRISGLTGDGQSSAGGPGITVFHAGTHRLDPTGPFYTAGGRVLGVTATGPTLPEARQRAYDALAPIEWDGVQVRSDIAAAAAASAQTDSPIQEPAQ